MVDIAGAEELLKMMPTPEQLAIKCRDLYIAAQTRRRPGYILPLQWQDIKIWEELAKVIGSSGVPPEVFFHCFVLIYGPLVMPQKLCDPVMVAKVAKRHKELDKEVREEFKEQFKHFAALMHNGVTVDDIVTGNVVQGHAALKYALAHIKKRNDLCDQMMGPAKEFLLDHPEYRPCMASYLPD